MPAPSAAVDENATHIHFSANAIEDAALSLHLDGGENLRSRLASKKHGAITYTLTGPPDALECLAEVLPPGTPLQNVLSPVSMASTGAMKTGAPEDTHSFGFSYPFATLGGEEVGRLLETTAAMYGNHIYAQWPPWLAFVLTGGFCYFSSTGELLGANALSLEPTRENARLTLVGPYRAAAQAGEALRPEARLRAVTLPTLISAGFNHFGWVFEGEAPGGHALGKEHECAAFVYAHTNGTFFYYQLYEPTEAAKMGSPATSSSGGVHDSALAELEQAMQSGTQAALESMAKAKEKYTGSSFGVNFQSFTKRIANKGLRIRKGPYDSKPRTIRVRSDTSVAMKETFQEISKTEAADGKSKGGDALSRSLDAMGSQFSALGFVDLVSAFGGMTKVQPDETHFERDVHKVRSMIDDSRRGVFDPHGMKMQVWDVVIMLGMVLVSTLTPFEIAFIQGNPRADSALFVINQLINLIFTVDLVLNFFLPYEHEKKFVRSRAKIAMHYLRFWFFIDLISIFPFDLCFLAGVFGPLESPTIDPRTLRTVRIVRLVRILKMMRVMRGSRIFLRWQDSLGVAYTMRALIFWVNSIAATLHWGACLWRLIADVQGTSRDDARLPAVLLDRMLVDSACTGCMPRGVDESFDEWLTGSDAAACSSPCSTPCEIELVAMLNNVSVAYQGTQENWMCRLEGTGIVPPLGEVFRTYVACVFHSVLLLAGSFYYMPANAVEHIVVGFYNILGLVLWAIVQGVVCAMLTTGNPFETDYKNRLDAVNFLMKDMKLPSDLRRRMRAYMRTTKETKKRGGFVDLVRENFSDELSQEIHFGISGSLFARTVPYFAKLTRLGHPDPPPHAAGGGRFVASGAALIGGVLQKSAELTSNLTNVLTGADDASAGAPGVDADLAETEVDNTHEFFEKLSPKITREAFAPGELIEDPASAIYVITKGSATRWGQVLLAGDYFGHDTIIACPALRDNRAVRVLTYLEVAKLHREHLFEVLTSTGFEDVAHFIKLEAVRMATSCVITLSSLLAQQMNERVSARGHARVGLSKAFRSVHAIVERRSVRPGLSKEREEVWEGVAWRDLDDERAELETTPTVERRPGLSRKSSSRASLVAPPPVQPRVAQPRAAAPTPSAGLPAAVALPAPAAALGGSNADLNA